MELAIEVWVKIDEETINKWVDSMPERLKRVLMGSGKLTAY